MLIKHWLVVGLTASTLGLACDPLPHTDRSYCTDTDCLAAHVTLFEGGTALKLVDVPTDALAKAVRPLSPGAAWAVGEGGTILGWDGWAWTSWPSTTSEALYSVWGVAPNDVWAVGRHLAIVRWDGTRWSTPSVLPPVPASTALRTVWSAGPSDVYMAGDSCTAESSCTESVIIHWNGSTFTTQKETARIYKIWGSSPKDVWASAANGKMFHYDGTTWSDSTTGVSDHLIALWGRTANDVWAGGGFAAGEVIHFDGTKWTKTSFADRGPAAMWGTGANDVWAVGNEREATAADPAPNGTGRAMHWDGAAWTGFPIATADIIGGISGASSKDVWAAGYEGIFHWNGAEWQPTIAVDYLLLDVFAFPAVPAAAGGPAITRTPPPAIFPDTSAFRTPQPLPVAWTDETNLCRPGFCLSVCSRGMQCAGTSKCTGSLRDGAKSGTSQFTVAYDIDNGYVPDFVLAVTPVSTPECPGNEGERLAAGDQAVIAGRAAPVAQGYALNLTPAGAGDGGGGGTCTDGWYGSTRSCLPLGAGGSCDCNASSTNTCITQSDFQQQAGAALPAACLPAGDTGCINGSGTLVHPCCPGLSCVVGGTCGGQAGGVCMVK